MIRNHRKSFIPTGYLQCCIPGYGRPLMLYGSGLPQGHVAAPKSTHAIEVIRQRLALLQQKIGHHPTITITDKSRTGEGTGVRVTMEIPFLLASQVN
jgi:hypothetical protein